MSYGTPERYDLQAICNVNLARALRWHNGSIAEWSTLEWAGAMAGEAGEAANAAKILKRIDGGLQNENTTQERAEAVQRLADEIADTFIYLTLLAAREGIDLGNAVASKFNRTSEKYGFPERISLES